MCLVKGVCMCVCMYVYLVKDVYVCVYVCVRVCVCVCVCVWECVWVGRGGKDVCACRAWWHMPLIPALRRQRQADFWVRGQPGLQSEFQDSQGYTEKPCLEKTTPHPPKKDVYACTQHMEWSEGNFKNTQFSPSNLCGFQEPNWSCQACQAYPANTSTCWAVSAVLVILL
jgi:hypothetical protein